jgi:hypothetical protein
VGPCGHYIATATFSIGAFGIPVEASGTFDRRAQLAAMLPSPRNTHAELLLRRWATAAERSLSHGTDRDNLAMCVVARKKAWKN